MRKICSITYTYVMKMFKLVLYCVVQSVMYVLAPILFAYLDIYTSFQMVGVHPQIAILTKYENIHTKSYITHNLIKRMFKLVLYFVP